MIDRNKREYTYITKYTVIFITNVILFLLSDYFSPITLIKLQYLKSITYRIRTSNHSRGKSFAVFADFANHADLPLKIFLEYQRGPLTTQSMIPPRPSKALKCYVVRGLLV